MFGQAEGVLNSGRVRESGHFMKAINKRFKIHTNNPPKKFQKAQKKRRAEEFLNIENIHVKPLTENF